MCTCLQVKVVDASGLAGINGMIHRGDRICSVNGESLTGVSRKTALQILKKAGNTVTLEVARQVTNRSSNSNKTEQVLKFKVKIIEMSNGCMFTEILEIEVFLHCVMCCIVTSCIPYPLISAEI